MKSSRGLACLVVVLAGCFPDEAAAQVCPGGIVDTQAGVNTFAGCDTVTGDLVIQLSADIMDLTPLAAVTTVGGNLLVGNGDTSTLTSFSFPALTSVGGELAIFRNPALTIFSFPALTTVTRLLVNNHSALTSFSLPALTSAGGGLEVLRNSALTSFSFPALTSVGGPLAVFDNSALTSFSLPALNSVGSLFVKDNSALTSFSFPALTSVTGDLTVQDNPNLPVCCDLLPALATPPANVVLSGNATGCNSEAEIQAACGLPALPRTAVVLMILLLGVLGWRVLGGRKLEPAGP